MKQCREEALVREPYVLSSLLFIMVLLVSLPVFLPGHNFVGDDILCHMERIEGIKEGLLSGQFPVRLSPNHLGGYGMPSEIFYPDLFLYLPAALRIFGISLTTSWNAFLVMVNILTAAASWWAFSEYARSRRTGAIATMFYLVFLYRLVDMYTRSAAGEMLAMAFLPAALLSVWMMLRRDASYWPSVTIFMTCILQSHIITGILMIFVTALLVVASFSRLRIAGEAILKSAAMTCLLNLWFYAPLFYFHTHMDYWIKYWIKQNVGSSIADAVRPLMVMDFYMGSAMLVLLAGAMVRQGFRHQQEDTKSFWGAIFISGGIICLMSFATPWEIIGKMAGVLQFPYRLAIFPAILIPLALAMFFSRCRHMSIVVLCALVCLGGNFFWLVGNTYQKMPERFSTLENQARATAPVSVLDEKPSKIEQWIYGRLSFYADYADVDTVKRLCTSGDFLQRKVGDHARDIHPSDRILDMQRRGVDFQLSYAAGREEWIQLPVFWYPGYDAEDTAGGAVQLQRDGDGQVSIHLPRSAGTVHVWYRGLPWFCIVDTISLFSFMGFCCVLYRSYRRGREIWTWRESSNIPRRSSTSG